MKIAHSGGTPFLSFLISSTLQCHMATYLRFIGKTAWNASALNTGMDHIYVP
jgi:hypothetical protein